MDVRARLQQLMDERDWTIYRLAKEEGCKFYLASDAHHPDQLDIIPERAPAVVEALGLTEDDQFILA